MRPAIVLTKMYTYEFNMEPGEHEKEVLALFRRAVDEWFHITGVAQPSPL